MMIGCLRTFDHAPGAHRHNDPGHSHRSRHHPRPLLLVARPPTRPRASIAAVQKLNDRAPNVPLAILCPTR